MRTYRENPDGEENQKATKDNEREIFALRMGLKKMGIDPDQFLEECHEIIDAAKRDASPTKL